VKYIICTFVDSFKFPLREALRKQVWWSAKEKKKYGHEVEIIIFGKSSNIVVYEGIRIVFLDKNRLLSYFLKAERVDFIVTIIELRLLMSIFIRGVHTVTICDGYPLGEDKIFLRKLILKFLPYLFFKINVYSKFQKRVLSLKNAKIIKPILPIIKKNNFKRHESPTLLYMGHISQFKGVDAIISAYTFLRNKDSNLNLIIANNMVRGEPELIKKVNKLKNLYPGNVTIKGVVDPVEELSKAWIYLYPFKKPGGTMAFALSLYESEQCNTPYIACNVGSNAEFFNNNYLVHCDDFHHMANKIRQILNDEYNYKINF
jgi:glycosyltransferase involved in cell wall biosynthesis